MRDLEETLRILEITRENYSHLIDITINTPNNNNFRTAIERLPDKIYDRRLKNSFAFHAKLHRDVKRKDGSPYFIHQAQIVEILSYFLNDDNDFKEQAKRYALAHDSLEEGVKYSISEYNQYKNHFVNQYGNKFLSEIESSVLLAQSGELDKYQRKVAGPAQVKARGDNAMAYALVADKMHNMIDLGYIRDDHTRSETEKKEEMAKLFIAPAIYVANELRGMAEELFDPTMELAHHVMQKENVEMSTVQKYLLELEKTRNREMNSIQDEKNRYQRRYGVESSDNNRIYDRVLTGK